MKVVAQFMLASTLLLSACGPCAFVTNQQSCEYAIANIPRLPKINVGMTTDEVRTVMKHDAERREADGDNETWFYMSDYENGKMSAIVFTRGRVTSIKQVAVAD